MWFSSSAPRLGMLALALLLAMLSAGCIHDSPTETDMPWSAPSAWEGTIPLPSGFRDRYQE